MSTTQALLHLTSPTNTDARQSGSHKHICYQETNKAFHFAPIMPELHENTIHLTYRHPHPADDSQSESRLNSPIDTQGGELLVDSADSHKVSVAIVSVKQESVTVY